MADGEYSGGLYVRLGALLDATVPPGEPITLQFAVEIPDDSREASSRGLPCRKSPATRESL